jgi:exodeoxyribonuclease VII small subunit
VDAAGVPALTPPGARGDTCPMPRKDTPAPSPVADFEQSLDALEQLVERMEQGDMSLEDSLAAYERGVGLYRRCQTALEEAEMRVRLLTDPQDPASAQPYPDAPGADA